MNYIYCEIIQNTYPSQRLLDHYLIREIIVSQMAACDRVLLFFPDIIEYSRSQPENIIHLNQNSK